MNFRGRALQLGTQAALLGSQKVRGKGPSGQVQGLCLGPTAAALVAASWGSLQLRRCSVGAGGGRVMLLGRKKSAHWFRGDRFHQVAGCTLPFGCLGSPVPLVRACSMIQSRLGQVWSFAWRRPRNLSLTDRPSNSLRAAPRQSQTQRLAGLPAARLPIPLSLGVWASFTSMLEMIQKYPWAGHTHQAANVFRVRGGPSCLEFLIF